MVDATSRQEAANMMIETVRVSLVNARKECVIIIQALILSMTRPPAVTPILSMKALHARMETLAIPRSVSRVSVRQSVKILAQQNMPPIFVSNILVILAAGIAKFLP